MLFKKMDKYVCGAGKRQDSITFFFEYLHATDRDQYAPKKPQKQNSPHSVSNPGHKNAGIFVCQTTIKSIKWYY